MIRRQKDGVEWLEFELLAQIPSLAHGVFLRRRITREGTSVDFHVGARKKGNPEEIRENLSLIKNIMGVDHLVSAHQVHGKSLVHVEEPLEETPRCDGFITSSCELGLLIKHADCQAAIFFDTEQHVLANVHCGWRGNVENIYAATVLKMQQLFTSRPENILVGISPSLGPEKSEFIHYRQELPSSFLPYQIKPTYFDLWAIARMQLESVGILPHHIEIASLCTYSHPEDFFSYRRDKEAMLSHATVAALKPVY